MSKTSLAVISALLAIEVALLLGAGYYLGWRAVLGECFATGLAGLTIMGFALWRYGGAVIASPDSDERCDEHCDGRRIAGLLFVAGFLLLIPGLILDVVAVLLLLMAAHHGIAAWIRSNERRKGARLPAL